MKRLRAIAAFTVAFGLAASAGLDVTKPGYDLTGALILGTLGACIVHVWFAPLVLQRARDLEVARAAYNRFSTVWCPEEELSGHLNDLIDDIDAGRAA